VSYRHSDKLSLNFGARLEWVSNRGYIPGQDDINQVYVVEVTYAFDTKIGAGDRTAQPREAATQTRR